MVSPRLAASAARGISIVSTKSLVRRSAGRKKNQNKSAIHLSNNAPVSLLAYIDAEVSGDTNGGRFAENHAEELEAFV